MYYPYFRGKQNELLAIRETAQVFASKNFVPIIEPVKADLGNLMRALKALRDVEGKSIVIVNPYYGEHSADGKTITNLLEKSYIDNDLVTAGILLANDMSVDDALCCYEKHLLHKPTFIHAGFSDADALASALKINRSNAQHVFIDDHCGTIYTKSFLESSRIVVKDGFSRMKNADYPEVEFFSDIHLIFQEQGMNGFGDFLTVGDAFSESGGPAYAIAIHLTFIDPNKNDGMYIRHFVSTSNDLPTNPAGKFAEALGSLVKELKSGKSKIEKTDAVKELLDLHDKGHFPGLGVLKKISMKHHIETIANYFS